jgi:hypothetical protein
METREILEAVSSLVDHLVQEGPQRQIRSAARGARVDVDLIEGLVLAPPLLATGGPKHTTVGLGDLFMGVYDDNPLTFSSRDVRRPAEADRARPLSHSNHRHN